MAESPAEKLISRLKNARPTGDSQWKALCPAHDDRSPSLSIKETPDGTLLIKCWSGCGAADVVAAAGLQLHDLFPDDPAGWQPRRAIGPRWSPRDALDGIQHQAQVAAIIVADFLRDGELSEAAFARLTRASALISEAMQLTNNTGRGSRHGRG